MLLHLAGGNQKITACWEGFLDDIKARGLEQPLLCLIDGNPGLRKAVRRKFSDVLVQRSQVHKMSNIINKLPQLAQPTLKKLIYKAFTARSYKDGIFRAWTIIADYKESFPASMKCLEQDLEETLPALKFPLVHRVRIRTSNLLERLFGEGRRCTKIILRFTSEANDLSLVFAVLVDASEGWRGRRIKPYLE